MYLRYFKRPVDVVGSLLLLLLLSWLLLLIVALYTFSFSFPIIFSQVRIGRNGKPFTLYKFRSLKVSPLPLMQRRFVLGNLLRATSFDELPQLLNVLTGDMSLIGPRPLPTEYHPLFSQEQDQRHRVRPGITGMAQVNGRHSISWQEKFALDLYYIRNASFWLDASIFLKTFFVVLSFRKDASLEEKQFVGNG